MSKVSYTNLKLKINNSVETFDFNGQNIEVKQYLAAEDKYDLIMITLQKSEEDGIYNPFKLDLYFHLHLVFMYTNLSFTERQKDNELKLYDTLKSNGFIDLMLEYIPTTEYNDLITFMEEIKHDILEYTNTAGAVLQKVINDLPKNAQVAREIVDSFDKEKYQEVIAFAEAANGNRTINKVREMTSPNGAK